LKRIFAEKLFPDNSRLKVKSFLKLTSARVLRETHNVADLNIKVNFENVTQLTAAQTSTLADLVPIQTIP
jgi:hypothetical protein